MTRRRRRTAVLVHYAAVAALLVLTVTDALPLRVFVTLVAVSAVALIAIERWTLGGLSLRSAHALDEREHRLVAESHRRAHRIGLALAGLLALSALVVGAGGGSPRFALAFGLTALTLLALFVTLPSAVVLWSAPDQLADDEAPGPAPT